MLTRNCFLRLLLDPMAGDLSGGGSTTPDVATEVDSGGQSFEGLSNATVPDPVATPATSATPAAALVPADPNQAAGNPAAAQQKDWRSISAVASQMGYRIPASVPEGDDNAFLMHLLEQARNAQQSNVYSQLGQRLAPRAAEIDAYLKQQQVQQAAPARQPWEAPEFDDRWAGLVERDPGTGLFYGKPGTPPEIVNKVNAYVEWKADYDRNPARVMNQMVDARAKEIFQQGFKEQFAAQARQSEIGRIVSENTEWLYQKDASGQPARDYMGRAMPTPVGARYMHHLQAIQQMGVSDPRNLDNLAKTAVRAEFAAQHAQAQQLAAAQHVDPLTVAAAGQPNINPLQATTIAQRSLNPAATVPSAVGKSLADLMREQMLAAGVTDADFGDLV